MLSKLTVQNTIKSWGFAKITNLPFNTKPTIYKWEKKKKNQIKNYFNPRTHRTKPNHITFISIGLHTWAL